MDNPSLSPDSHKSEKTAMEDLSRDTTTQPSPQLFYIVNDPGSKGEIKIPSHPRKIIFDLYEHSEVKANPSELPETAVDTVSQDIVLSKFQYSVSVGKHIDGALKWNENPQRRRNYCLLNRFRKNMKQFLKLYSYVRISSRVPDHHLIEDVSNRVWGKNFHPELAITFLGGCKEQLLTEAVKKCLRKCISSIIEKFKCCFITRGSCMGIAKLAGKLFSKETLKWNYGCMSKSIGILPWLHVHGREKLHSDQGSTVIEYPKLSLTNATSSPPSDWPLDPNHDFYYFIDDGSNTPASRVATDFIVKLNMMMLEGRIGRKYPVPCVMILTGGGKQSLEAMHNFLQKSKPMSKTGSTRNGKNLKPVVIVIKESGKLADLLSLLVEANPSADNFNDALKDAEDTINRPRNDQRSNFTEKLKETPDYETKMKDITVEHVGQIIIFKLEERHNAECDLEKVLLNAVSDAGVGDYMTFLLAIFAGHADTVRKHFTEHPKTVSDMMTNSILKSDNLTRAKDILEKYKFNVEDYVRENLLKLYKLDKAKRPRVNVSEFDPVKLLEFYEDRYGKKEADGTLDSAETMNDLTNGSTVINNNEIVNPIQALFINSILFLDVNAAKLFWNFDPYNPLSNALLAYALLNGLKGKAKDVSKSARIEFEQALKYFESLVCALLETYYKIDQEMAQKVLCKKIPLWNDRTVIDIAGEIGLKSFFSKQACERKLEKDWYETEADDKLDSDETMKDLTNGSTVNTIGNNKGDDEKRAGKSRSKCTFPDFTAPIWKMRLHLFVYLVSLGLFAVYVLFTNTVAHNPIKWIVAAVVFSLAVDEIRQITDYKRGWRRNIWQWISNIWNKFDLVAILLFSAGLAFSPYFKYVSKVMFSLYLVVSCLKVMQFLRAMDFIGVYLVMIYKMLGRMKMFLIVFLVTILGYGLFMTALLHPEASLDWTVLFHILFRPSLVLIGEPGIESFQLSSSSTIFGTGKVDLASEILVIIGMAIFLLFANILLVNLLIADFSNIHSEISCTSEEIWRYEQYLLLQEFKNKPNFPIPFSVFENLCSLLRKFCKKVKRCCGSKNRQNEDTDAEKLARREIEEFERFCFKKRFPKIPEDIIYPVTEEDIRSKMKIPVDDESFQTLGRPDGEMKLPKMYLTRN